MFLPPPVVRKMTSESKKIKKKGKGLWYSGGWQSPEIGIAGVMMARTMEAFLEL